MACTNPFDAFRMATESLGEELYRRAYYRGIWLNLIPRGVYKQGTGLTQHTFTIGKSEPIDDTETWNAVRTSTGATDPAPCNTTWNEAYYGFEELTYNPEQFGLRGPVICQDDLIYNFNAERFLSAYLHALAMRSRRSIENRYLNLYSHFVPKNIADASFTFYAGGTGTVPTAGPSLCMEEADCELTQEMLDEVAIELNENGATDPNSDGWINLGEDGPVYPLYIGQRASQRILLNNADVRQDRRDADSGMGDRAEFFRRLGATRVIKNFRHVINLFPPRFIYNGATNCYIRINTWENDPAATKGTTQKINDDWKDAPYEAAYVLSPWVFHSEIVRPVNSAAGLNWMPKNYFGEWQWVTGGTQIYDEGGADVASSCYDPLKKLGRHFAEYKHAPRPIFPEFGRMIIFRRCPTTDFSCPTCAS